MKILTTNKKAYFNYEVLETFVAGIQLEGREVKSLRTQGVQFAGSFVTVRDGKPYLLDLSIPRYRYDGGGEYDPKRRRLLLLKKKEIERLEGLTSQKGVTIVPLEIGFEREWAKIKIGLVRGKKQFDKRRSIKEREEKRKIQKIIKRAP